MSAQATLPRSIPVEFGAGASALMLAVGLIGYGAANLGHDALSVSLYGQLDMVDTSAVASVAQPHAERGFFLLDAEQLESELAALDWVRSASVQRLWPDRVAIRIESYSPLASWGAGQVLAEDGSLLPRPAGFESAIEVDGPAAQAPRIAVQVRAAIAAAGEYGYRLRAWTVSADGDTTAILQLRDGRQLPVELGRDALSLHLDTLLSTALPILLPRIDEVAGIDLRYRNGFAVRWKGAGGDEKQ